MPPTTLNSEEPLKLQATRKPPKSQKSQEKHLVISKLDMLATGAKVLCSYRSTPPQG